MCLQHGYLDARLNRKQSRDEQCHRRVPGGPPGSLRSGHDFPFGLQTIDLMTAI